MSVVYVVKVKSAHAITSRGGKREGGGGGGNRRLNCLHYRMLTYYF